MERLLTHVRSRSSLLFSPTRSLSSFKPNSFDSKSRTLLNLINQSNRTKSKPTNIDLISESNNQFPLPGNIGFAHEIKLSTNFVSSSTDKNENEPLLKLINNNPNIEIRSYGCPSTVRSQFKNLFLNYNLSIQPLTAITILYKTKLDMSKWSIEIENERYQLTEQFKNLAQDICTYLNKKNYWVDFIDPSNGKPYYGPSTSDTLFETDERFRHFGMNIVDLGCCRVIEHLQHGTHVFVGCIFTSALKTDSNIQHLLKEFSILNCST